MSQAGAFIKSIVPPVVAVQTIEGNTGGPVSPDGSNNINVIGDGTTISITGNPGTHTLTAAFIGSIPSPTQFPTDAGTAIPSAGNLNIIADTADLNAGSTVSFSASGNTVLFNISAGNNTIVGDSSGNATITGIYNTAFGINNVSLLTSGNQNTVLGHEAATNLTTGTGNIVIGESVGSAYTGNESGNICVGFTLNGVTGESNTTRIGNNSAQQVFITGIDDVNVGSVAKVVTENGNQLGTAIISGGTGITVTAGPNSIVVSGSGTIVFTYTNVNTSPYVVLVADDYISVDCSGGAITIQLPNGAVLGKTFVIKDRTGSAATHNITVTTVGGLTNIDGAASFVMNTAFQSISLIGNNVSYEIY